MRTRDNALCACGHKSVSHGSYTAGEFVGIGLGPCGIDRDTRNALAGWIGDPCPCLAFDRKEPNVSTPTIRTNAHPVILASTNEARTDLRHVVNGRDTRTWGPRNPLLTWARDLIDGDPYGWGMALLEVTQALRVAYDSPRIGGGIDPAIASNVMSVDDLRFEGGMAAYLLGDPTDPDDTSALDGLTLEQIQDAIVHAEAVAVRYIALCEREGRAY